MFLRADHDSTRLPVVLLSGFLGSGKTTLVNALLRDSRLAETAVAINEFGPVPLDQHLIDHGEDSTIVMANGCLCCNVAGDLESAVMRIFSRRTAGELPRFARLLIEPSGLADPAPIAQTILRNPMMSRALRLESIVTTVDALFVIKRLAEHRESHMQISLADQLILTKTDLTDSNELDRIKAMLRGLNPVAPIHEVIDGAIDPGLLLPPGFLDPTLASAVPMKAYFAAGPADAEHVDETVAISLVAAAPLRWRLFDVWLRGIRIGHAEKLLRLKGLLNVEEGRRPIVIQGVHHVMHTPVELQTWPSEDRSSRIVLITKGLARGTIEASWKQALPSLVTVS